KANAARRCPMLTLASPIEKLRTVSDRVRADPHDSTPSAGGRRSSTCHYRRCTKPSSAVIWRRCGRRVARSSSCPKRSGPGTARRRGSSPCLPPRTGLLLRRQGSRYDSSTFDGQSYPTRRLMERSVPDLLVEVERGAVGVPGQFADQRL